MRGKVCVVTGATSGIGLATAEALVAMGARIVIVARDRGRGEATVRRIGGPTTVHYGDLSLIAEMKRVADEIAAAEPKIDVLINCAGAAFSPREETADGIEKTFALNHLSYFVLTNQLLPNVRAAAPSRIVSVASDAHYRGTIDFDDLMMKKRYGGFAAYANSKLANILFTRELARRLAGTGVTANAMHPGIVNTRWGDNVGGIASLVVGIGKAIIGRSPKKGADTVVYLASSPDVANVSGEYFVDRRATKPSAAAQDGDAARRLWDVSAKLTGVGA